MGVLPGVWVQGSGSPGQLVGQGRLGHFRFLQVSTLSSVVSFLTELRGKLLSSYLEEKLSAFLLLVKSRKKKKQNLVNITVAHEQTRQTTVCRCFWT